MKRILGRLPAALALVTSMALAAPAVAATGTLDDDTGDATQKGLDITRAVLDNRDHAIVVRVRFDDVRRGDLIVSVDPRKARGVRLVSEHRPHGETTNQVLGSAFSDGPGGDSSQVDCPGFRVRWNDDTDTARLRLPSTCLQDGDYGAVRFAVLTENGSGDADFAPDGKKNDAGFIARG